MTFSFFCSLSLSYSLPLFICLSLTASLTLFLSLVLPPISLSLLPSPALCSVFCRLTIIDVPGSPKAHRQREVITFSHMVQYKTPTQKGKCPGAWIRHLKIMLTVAMEIYAWLQQTDHIPERDISAFLVSDSYWTPCNLTWRNTRVDLKLDFVALIEKKVR